MIPGLFFGEDGGRVFRADRGATDAGVSFDMVAESADVPAAGEDGETAFFAMWLTVTYSGAPVLRITPMVDGVLLHEAAHTLALAPISATGGRRTVQAPEMQVRVRGRNSSGQAFGLFTPRGARLAVRVESVGGTGTGALIIDAVVLEHEQVRTNRGFA